MRWKHGYCGVIGAESVLGRGEKVIASQVGIKLLLDSFSTSLAKAGMMEIGRKLGGSEGLLNLWMRWTMECFQDSGTSLAVRQELRMKQRRQFEVFLEGRGR